MIRAICNQCGRANLGEDFIQAQGGIDHKDSCPKVSKPKVKVVKADPPKEEKPKSKKSKKTSSDDED